MTFLDDFLGHGSIIYLKRKSKAATNFHHWFAHAKKSSGNKLLKLHSDYGAKYLSLDL